MTLGIRSVVGVLLLASTALTATVARAVEVDRPTVTIGGGFAATPLSDSQPYNVLLRVGMSGVGVQAGAFYLVIAQIRAEGTLSTQDNPAMRFPYMDIEFVPVEVGFGDGLSGGKFRIVPAQFGMDVTTQENYRVRVDVVGFEKNYLGPSHITQNSMLYAKLAADALGYKTVNYLNDIGSFHGANIAAVSAEIGLTFKLNSTFKVRIAFGGSADISMGVNGDDDFAVQSDLKAYNEISLDVTKYIRFFVRNLLTVGLNSGSTDHGSELGYQLMLGANFIF